MWHPAQQVVRGDDQTRRAEPAPDRARLDERLLDARSVESLDRDDLAALGLTAQDKAGAHQVAVEVDRARAALSLLARVLRAVQAQTLTQHVEQALARPDVLGDPALAIDRGRDLHAQVHRRHRRAMAATSSPNRSMAVVLICRWVSQAISSSSTPSRNLSASTARSGVGPAEPMPVPTRWVLGSRASANEHTAITMALRVPTLENCCGPAAGSTRKAAISSSGRIALRLGPVKNSRTGRRRVPDVEASSTVASEASSGGCASPAGEG